MLKKLIGTKQFYQGVIFVAAPIIIQNLVTNFVSLLDNIMVGQVGTEQMSGVAVVNQLLFVFNLGVWGITSGVGILGTQFFGKKDDRGVADSFKLKMFYSLIYLAFAYLILLTLGDKLCMAFLHEGSADLDITATFLAGKSYLRVMYFGLPFFAITQVYSSTLRELKETKMPMIASLTAVAINLVFNYLLIYGKFGFPELGIIGAAIATNMSRVAESLICVIYTHRHPELFGFIKAVYRDLSVRKATFKKSIVLVIPAFINEILWSVGQTMLNQCMSLRGVAIVSALNISNVVSTLSKSVFLAMGVSVAIMVGNALGAGDEELAVDTDRKMIFMSFLVSAVLGAVLFVTAGLIPELYNTTEEVKALSTSFIKISALLTPVEAVINACYHTIKSGGRSLITFLYDGAYTWVISVALAVYLGYFTNMPIVPMYACIFCVNIIKFIAGLILVKKKIWVRSVVE